MRVAVIGAGLGGLSAACHLAGRGHDVVVLERENTPGGRAAQVGEAGYRIDCGPTVLTMPGILQRTFAAANASMSDHVDIRPVDPMYRACFPDGSELRLRHGIESMVEEIRAVCGAKEADSFVRFCRWLRELHDLEFPHFIDRNFDSPRDLVRDPAALIRLVRLGAFRRVAPTVAAYFSDPRLRQVFSFQSMYAGLSPFEALAIYCVITYMDTVEGVYFPEGGVHELARGLAGAALKADVSFCYSAAVDRITRGPDGAVRGVTLESGEHVAADAVVCNVDVAAAYRTLLGIAPPRVVRRGRYSPSCAVWIVGARGAPRRGTAHHNLHFGSEWRAGFDAVLRDGRCMPEPSILVSVPTVSDPALAPEGGVALSALEPVPNLDGRVDWPTEGPRLRRELAARVSSLGYPVDDIVVERFIDPPGWRAQGLERGTPFSLAHRFLQTGPFRTPNVDPRVPGLVLVGMGTVPGVGIPMVLLSGRLAARRVEALARS